MLPVCRSPSREHFPGLTRALVENSGSTFIATPSNGTLNGNASTARLYIDTSNGGFNTVGFTDSASSNSTATTSGFLIFGSLLMWKSSEGQVQSKWYASPTDVKDVYVLKWNVDNIATESATPIVLKTHQ